MWRRPNLNAVCLFVCSLLILAFAGTDAFAAPATVLNLRNGDRLTGKVLREDTNQITFQTTWHNVVVVPVAEVKSREPLPAPTPAATVAGQAVKPGTVLPPSSILPGGGFPAPPGQPVKAWAGEAQAGLDLVFSERNRQLYSGRLKVSYTAPPFRHLFDYQAAYGKTDGLLSDNRMFGTLKTDWELGRGIYVYNLAGAGLDRVRKIDLRYEEGPGIGWHAIKTTNFILNTEIGGNYQAQYYSDRTRTESFYLRVAEDAAWKITPRITIDEKFEFFPRIENTAQYRFRAEANLRFALLNNFSLILTLLEQYDTNPARGVPQNSLQLTSSIGVKF